MSFADAWKYMSLGMILCGFVFLFLASRAQSPELKEKEILCFITSLIFAAGAFVIYKMKVGEP